MATSYNGWPASPYPSRIGIVHFEPIPGYDFPGGIKGGDVKTIFTYLVRQLDARVEPIEYYRPGDEWGWHYKASTNSPTLLSCHSSGTAIDYNATRHPNGVRGTWKAWQVTEIRKILQECGGVVRWLYDATRTPDEMHFEIRGTVSQVAAVAARLRGQMPAPSTSTPTPTSAPQEDIMATLAELNAAIKAAEDRQNVWIRSEIQREIKASEDRQNAWIRNELAGSESRLKANAKIMRDGLAALVRRVAEKLGITGV